MRSSPVMQLLRALICSLQSSVNFSISFARGRSASPFSVSMMLCDVRISSLHPNSSSRALMCWLMADWVTKHLEAAILKESVSATYANERKCLNSIIFCSFSYTIYIKILCCKNRKNILYENVSCIKKSNYGIRYLVNERYMQFICRKKPRYLALLRLNTEALANIVLIANGTHWIGERLFIVCVRRGRFIVDGCYLLATLR